MVLSKKGFGKLARSRTFKTLEKILEDVKHHRILQRVPESMQEENLLEDAPLNKLKGGIYAYKTIRKGRREHLRDLPRK